MAIGGRERVRQTEAVEHGPICLVEAPEPDAPLTNVGLQCVGQRAGAGQRPGGQPVELSNINGGFDVQLSYNYAAPLTGVTFGVAVTDVGGQSTAASISTFSMAHFSVHSRQFDSARGDLRYGLYERHHFSIHV